MGVQSLVACCMVPCRAAVAPRQQRLLRQPQPSSHLSAAAVQPQPVAVGGGRRARVAAAQLRGAQSSPAARPAGSGADG